MESAAAQARRAYGPQLAFSFFGGVVLGILGLGIAAAKLGRLLAGWSVWFALLAGAVSLTGGLAALLAPHLRRRFAGPRLEKRGGLSGAFLYGLTYTLASVTTGAGPLLLLLTVVAAIGRPLYGGVLALAYGVGRGLPFLALGMFAGAGGAWLGRIERLRRPAEIVSGLALVAIAGYFGWLASVLIKS